MIVSMWMTRDVITIAPDTLIADASAVMAKKRIRRLLVAETYQTGQRLLGIVSASDIFQGYPAGVNPYSARVSASSKNPVTVSEIMKHEPLTTTPDAPIESAAELMRDRKIGALPVIRNGLLQGLITESDIFRAFVSFFSSPRSSVRITFDMSAGEDIFALIAEVSQKRGMRVVSLISTHQDDKPVCVVRVIGAAVDNMLTDLWRSGHHVLNVLHLD